MDAAAAGQEAGLVARYSRLLPLESMFRRLLERHMDAASAGAWVYSDYLPTRPADTGPLSTVAHVAVEVSLLTEVNLPWYTSYIASQLPPDVDSLRRFLRVWTSEEDQHATLLESFLLRTNTGDPGARATLRRSTIRNGFEPEFTGPFPIAVYTSLQEVQTRAFYLRAANVVQHENATLARAFRRLARDETLHAHFYRDIVAAHLAEDPDYVLLVARTVRDFRMPGYVQPGYEGRSEFATRHIFGASQFARDVLDNAWTTWRLDEIEPRHPAARAALHKLSRRREAFVRVARRAGEQRQEAPAE